VSGVPSSIGRYRVERLLGQGAMGSVYLGRDPQLDRAVAIKTVRKLDLEEARLAMFLERFKNEARAAARLSHPAIVAVYDVGEDEAVGPYLVFEYVAGSTLKQIVRGRGPLPPADVIKMGRQIAAALDTAHAAEVIHRDIKPDNILVSAAGDAKLADFGVARLPDAALTKEGQFLGTPCYAAPETLSSGTYGPHSDLFSFAAVLYEAVSGARAFPGDDAIGVAHHVVHDEPELPSKVAPSARIPKEVDRVLMRGLSKDPEARQRSAASMVEALRLAYVQAGVLEDDPAGAQPVLLSEPPPKPKGATWAFGLVLGGGLAVGVALVVAFGDFGGGVVGGGGGDAGVDERAVDAAVVDGGAGLERARDADRAEEPAVVVATDAGRRDRVEDAGVDAGAAERDAGLPSVDGMSAFDREEAAKDEVDTARARLAAGDVDGAAAALARARRYDAGNADIAALEAQIRQARAGQ
jgi:tRNA A-37 threonylcarbamoyl transferase component Bud32